MAGTVKDIQKYEQEIYHLKNKIEEMKEELTQERLRNLKNPISALGRILKYLNDAFYKGKPYELSGLLQTIKQPKYKISPEDMRTIEVLHELTNYPLGHWILALYERWGWLNEHQAPENDFLVHLAKETWSVVNSYHSYIIKSKRIFDKCDEFRKENGDHLRKMYDIYGIIVNETESFFKKYGTHYSLDYMELERIAY